MHKTSGAFVISFVLAVIVSAPAAYAQDCTDKFICGELSPLIPMQSTEAVHMGLVWKQGSQNPKLLFHARFPEYTPNDVADPAVVDSLIANGALTNGLRDFDRALRDVRHPSFRDGSDPHADSFQRLTYGGFLLRQGLSQSVPTRIVANRTMERQLLWDLSHPAAFANEGKFHTARLDEDDFRLNLASFKEVGYSAGNFYNTYCNARVTLADGRIYVFGGHDMQSNNGLYKVNIFDPATERWIERAQPCTRANWSNDPFGRALFMRDPNARNYEDCDQRDIESTQPSDPSDGKYARWYPSAFPLPNGMVLIIGGTDQDASVGPDPLAAQKGKADQPQSDTAFTATRVNQVTPELYDPKKDRHIALENARMSFPLYPQAEVVQTGPGQDDWVLCTHSGVPTQNLKNFTFDKKTWCLDVPAALNDPARDVPATNHYTLLSEAERDRHYCCPTASQVETDRQGRTVSHKWFMFSGRDRATGAQTATIEMINFTDALPQWRTVGQLLHPSTTSKVVLLPDGTILIGNGTATFSGATYEQRNGLRYQLFDPKTGLTRPLVKTTVRRGLHGTATLLPDGSALFAGENREALIPNDDPSFPMTADDGTVYPRGDADLGVPNGQIVRPPYLFNSAGNPAARPVISKAPQKLEYKQAFEIKVQGSSASIASVALVRSDHNTHSFTAGDRYVKLAFETRGKAEEGELRVFMPNVPAQAVPGIYMLFVTDQNGVPSVAKRVDLNVD